MNTGEAMSILALQGSPTIEEIRAARRLQLKVWHPDRFLDDPVVKAEAERRTKLINQAYKTLEPVAVRRTHAPDDLAEDGDVRPRAERVEERQAPHQKEEDDSHGRRWLWEVVAAALCASWLIPIVAGALGVIDETSALGLFIVLILAAWAYLVLARFFR